MIVADLMTRNAASVRSGQTLASAAQVMWDCDCGAVPVVEREGDKVIGMVTDRDICMATWSRGLPPSSIFVDEAMSKELVRCTANDTIAHAGALMRSNQIRRIPVVDSEGRLLGILSLADIARAMDFSKLRSDPELSSDGLATTLSGICKSHLTLSTRSEARASTR
jgi:CBS domain-containing protein